MAISIFITVSSVYILSNLITDLTEKANDEVSERNFMKKQEFLSQEFSKFLEHENRIKHVLKISKPENLASNLKILSSVQNTNLLIADNWFQINDNKIEFGTDSISDTIKKDAEDFILQNKNADHKNTIIPQGKEWVWRIYFKIASKS